MGLDAVSLFVVVRHVQHLKTEVGPLRAHALCIDRTHVDGHVHHGQHSTLVDALAVYQQTKSGNTVSSILNILFMTSSIKMIAQVNLLWREFCKKKSDDSTRFYKS